MNSDFSTGSSSSASAPGVGSLSAGRSVIARCAVAAEETLNVSAMSAGRLGVIALYHECPIARFEAARELLARRWTQ